jgi:O-antigen/teichoic acid export membrane protein
MIAGKNRTEHFYDWMNNKTGLDFRYFLLNGNWVSLRFLVVSLTGFTLSFFFTNFGSKELLGQYQLALSILAIVSLVSFLGLNSSAMEGVVRGRDASVFRAARLIFCFSWIGSPILIALGLYYTFILEQSVFGSMLMFSAFLFPFFYATSSWNIFYEGKQLFKESALRIITLNLILTGALVVAILLDLNAFWLLGIYLGVSIILQAKFLLTIFRDLRDRTNDYIDTKFGIAVSFQKFVSGLSSNLPPLVISFFFGIEILAIYYIAYFVVSAFSSFLNNIFSLYLPILFKKVALNHRSILLNSVITGVLGWLAFIIFLKFFFIRIYGDGYQDSLRLAYAISFLLLLIPLHTYLVGFFSTRRKNRFLISIFILANCIGVLEIYFMNHLGFFWSIITYLYTLEIITTLPLLGYYVYQITRTSKRVSF